MNATRYWAGRVGRGGFLAAVLCALMLCAPARAGTIAVTTTFDQVNATAPCSLREAVNTANQDIDSGGCTDLNPAAADTITLGGGDYDISRRSNVGDDFVVAQIRYVGTIRITRIDRDAANRAVRRVRIERVQPGR